MLEVILSEAIRYLKLVCECVGVSWVIQSKSYIYLLTLREEDSFNFFVGLSDNSEVNPNLMLTLVWNDIKIVNFKLSKREDFLQSATDDSNNLFYNVRIVLLISTMIPVTINKALQH